MEPDRESESNLRKKRKIRSSFWEYFIPDDKHGAKDRTATCRICDGVISTSGGTTSGMGKHLAFIHNIKREAGADLPDGAGIVEELRREWMENREEKEGKYRKKSPVDAPAKKRSSRRHIRPRNKSSPTWEFFAVVQNGQSARCKICNKILKTSGGCTSGIMRHLASMHDGRPGNMANLRRAMRQNPTNQEEDGYSDDGYVNLDESDTGSSSGIVVKTDPLMTSEDDTGKEDEGGDLEEEMAVGESYDMAANDDQCQDKDPLLINVKKEVTVTVSKGSGSKVPVTKTSCCFICNSKLNSDSQANSQNLSPEEYRFLLMEMLELPTKKTLRCLEELKEGLEEWLLLCQSCQDIVCQGLSARKKIIRLQLRIEQCQSTILKKIKSNKGGNAAAVMMMKWPKRQRQVLEGIRYFVNSRKYSALDSEGEMDNFNEDQMDSPEPEPPSPVRVEALHCGLCGDDKAYTSSALLTAHTKRVHGPPLKITSSFSLASSSKLQKPTFGLGGKRRLPPPERRRRKRNLTPHLIPSKRYLYDCPNCPLVKGYSVAKFVLHLAIHQRRPFQCSICFEFFPQDESLQEQHWLQKHSSLEHPCPDTDQRFVKIKFHPGRIWKCAQCLEGFYSESERDQHETSCLIPEVREELLPLTEAPPHHCSICSLGFRNIPEWRLHRALHHPEVDRMSCYYCDSSFLERTVEGVETRHDRKMVHHMSKEHNDMRLFDSCDLCGLVFGTGDDKKEHSIQRHAIPKDEVFSCGICAKNVASLQNLRKHMSMIHFESNLSICGTCGKKFLGREALLHHDFVLHGNNSEALEVLQCPEESCSYKALFRRRLDTHFVAVHEGERTRPHVCRFCGKGFKTTGALISHEEIHTNKDSRPYQCELCGSSFAVRYYLDIHKAGVHGGKHGWSYRRHVKKAKALEWKSRNRSSAPATSSTAEFTDTIATPTTPSASCNPNDPSAYL